MADDKPRWYLSVVADRHVEHEYKLFDNLSYAMEYTVRRFREVVTHPWELEPIYDPGRPWLIGWTCGEEGDHAEVVEIEEWEDGDE